VESPDRFARDLAAQLAGHDMPKGLGIAIIPASAPDFFTEDTPTAVLVANLGFEAQLFLAADKLRKNLEPSDYKHVCLGLIFLKHISNAFEEQRCWQRTPPPKTQMRRS
jgi:hypothetical protein